MRKLLISLMLLLAVSCVYSQINIDTIKSRYQEIRGQVEPEGYVQQYKQDRNQSTELASILGLDVFQYYKLYQYSTDLKRQVYSKTTEFQDSLNSLKKIKQSLLSRYYYLDYAPNFSAWDNERTYDQLNYNLATHTFEFLINCKPFEAIGGEGIYDRTNLQFDHISMPLPQGFSVIYKRLPLGSIHFTREYVKFIVANESVALKIEDNKANVRILFLFKFTSTKASAARDYGLASNPNPQVELFDYTDHWLLTKLDKAIVYNAATGEVYKEYKYIQPQTTPVK
jgi:hypothetical protein